MEIWQVIAAVIVFILKDYITDRRNNKKIETINQLNKEKESAQDSIISNLEDLLYKHLNSDSFRKKFRNSISNYTSDKINNSELLPNEIYKKVLIDFSINITEFSLNFFYSDRRESTDITSEDRKLQLSGEMSSILYEFFDILKAEIKIEKAYEINNKTYMTTLPGWIIINDEMKQRDNPGIQTLCNNLVERFVINKIKENDLQQIVIDYLGKVIKKFKENITSFNQLKNYDDVMMERM